MHVCGLPPGASLNHLRHLAYSHLIHVHSLVSDSSPQPTTRQPLPLDIILPHRTRTPHKLLAVDQQRFDSRHMSLSDGGRLLYPLTVDNSGQRCRVPITPPPTHATLLCSFISAAARAQCQHSLVTRASESNTKGTRSVYESESNRER